MWYNDRQMENPVEEPKISENKVLQNGLRDIPKATQSFATIDTVFRNVQTVPSGGGFPVDRKPYYKVDGGHRISEDHQVKSYFSEQEMPYINATVAYLNLLANGHFLEKLKKLLRHYQKK